MRIYSHLCCQLLPAYPAFTTCYTNSADRQLCIGLTRIKSYLLLRISLPVHNGILTDFCIHTIVLCNQIYRYRISIHRNFLDIAARRVYVLSSDWSDVSRIIRPFIGNVVFPAASETTSAAFACPYMKSSPMKPSGRRYWSSPF